MSFNLSVILSESAKRVPEQTAVIFNETKLNYGTLNALASKVADALRQMGLEPGQKVGLMLPNMPWFPAIYYGILRASGVVVPMNVLLKAPEIEHYLSDSGAVALFCWEGFIAEAQAARPSTPGCRHWVVAQAPGSAGAPAGWESLSDLLARGAAEADTAQTSPDDTAVILYTSGTTGKPKGAEISHSNVYMNTQATLDRLNSLAEGWNEVALVAAPLFHSIGQHVIMNPSIFAGKTLTLLPRFDPVEALKIIQRDRVTFFIGVPTMFYAILNHPEADQHDLSSLKACGAGGAPVPVEIMNAWERKYGLILFEGYGLSEVTATASITPPESRKAGSIGRPVWGVEMRVVGSDDQPLPPGEVGEIVIRGPNVMKGYYNQPEANAEALRGGWFRSGDLGYMDADGDYWIVDRVKDMIIRGGFNVYPREIEEVLFQHPAVAEAAVIGVPHAALGEEVKAVVALKPGQQATEAELIAYVKERVAAYKYPRSLEFVAALPKGPTGKVLKRELKRPASPSGVLTTATAS